jgi:hypothetical protein
MTEFEFGYRNGRQFSHNLMDVTACGRDNLVRALGIALSRWNTDELTVCRVRHSPLQLTLYAHDGAQCNPGSPGHFDVPLDADGAAALVVAWLEHGAVYGKDEHDGASVPGWRVFNGQFGIVDGDWGTIVAVQPMWNYIPK